MESSIPIELGNLSSLETLWLVVNFVDVDLPKMNPTAENVGFIQGS